MRSQAYLVSCRTIRTALRVQNTAKIQENDARVRTIQVARDQFRGKLQIVSSILDELSSSLLRHSIHKDFKFLFDSANTADLRQHTVPNTTLRFRATGHIGYVYLSPTNETASSSCAQDSPVWISFSNQHKPYKVCWTRI